MKDIEIISRWEYLSAQLRAIEEAFERNGQKHRKTFRD